MRGAPRARRTSPEGALSPRARRTSPEGALSLVALVGRGGHQGRGRGMCVCFGFVGEFVFCIFYEVRWVFLRLFRGPLGLSPTLFIYE
jgi:hypothetical protein